MGWGFTSQELRIARRMRKGGSTFSAIARALGRRSHDGIRRRLDPEYHARRKVYQAAYAREVYNSKRRTRKVREFLSRYSGLSVSKSKG